jgi:hypothetical protein
VPLDWSSISPDVSALCISPALVLAFSVTAII